MFGGAKYPQQPKPEPKKPEPMPDFDSLPAEVAWIVEWRYKLLRGSGFAPDEAEILAPLLYVDHHEAEELRRAGCDFDSLLGILT